MDYNTKPDIPLEYCLYARKSSELDERQTMSIDSQIEEMMTLAKRDKLRIKEINLYFVSELHNFLAVP